jgi:hypothetical protein
MNTTQNDPTELETLKQSHKKVTTFIIPLDEFEDDETENRKVATVYLKTPDKRTRDVISDLMSKGKFEAAIISGLKLLRIGGDAIESFESNNYAMISVEPALVKHLEVGKTIIKKN